VNESRKRRGEEKEKRVLHKVGIVKGRREERSKEKSRERERLMGAVPWDVLSWPSTRYRVRERVYSTKRDDDKKTTI
jgi:hypothetical protein